MSHLQLFEKDNLIMEIINYQCIIHDFEHMPIGLRYRDVHYDDVMHGWLETRNMNIGRTNAKALLAVCGLPQNNPYTIAKMYHYATLSDCYWMKDVDEKIGWEDVSMFKNPPEKLLVKTALFGEHQILPTQTRVHTPELTTQGLSAKAWIREDDSLYMYKIGKIELAASQILDVLRIEHVPYVAVNNAEVESYVDELHLEKIKKNGEQIVKSKLITSEDISIVSWEDFAVCCDRNHINPYGYMNHNFEKEYYSMIVADYILGNEDRHTANYGFFVDNKTGKIIRPYPLMDHDHAFSNKLLITQTLEQDMLMQDAVKEALSHVPYIAITPVLEMKRPDTLNAEQWQGVLDRAEYALRDC